MKNRPHDFLARRLFLAALLGMWQWRLCVGPVLAQPALSSVPAGQIADKTYRVGPGDVISIAVFPVVEYSKEVTIQPDGTVELILIGGVLVKGLTADEIKVLLESQYKRFVAKPEITITVRRFSGRRVAILGEIRSPGFFEFRDGMTVMELLSLSGGLTEGAKPSMTVILRPGPPEDRVIKVPLGKIITGDLSKNSELRPGDTLYIHKAGYTKKAEWMNKNILPWMGLVALLLSIAVAEKTLKD